MSRSPRYRPGVGFWVMMGVPVATLVLLHLGRLLGWR